MLKKQVEIRDGAAQQQRRRMDRRTDMRGGGIALYAKEGYQHSIAHLCDSAVGERSWFIIHADSGPILLCLWYRRPDPGETG